MLLRLCKLFVVVTLAPLVYALTCGLSSMGIYYVFSAFGASEDALLPIGILLLAIVSPLVFYFAGYIYIRVSGDRSLIVAAIAGLSSSLLLFVDVALVPRGPKTAPPPALEVYAIMAGGVAIQIALSIWGGQAAIRKLATAGKAGTQG